MSFTPPNVFVAGTPVDAADLQENATALRLYLNRDIDPADLAPESVTTTDLVRGEYYNVTTDHQFMTGDLFTQFVEIDPFTRSYVTSHFKSYDLLAQKLQAVPNCAKRIYAEHDGQMVITIGASAVGQENYELEAKKYSNPLYLQVSTNDRVTVNDYKPATMGRAFTEDDVTADANLSGNTTAGGYRSRRWYAQRYLVPISGGTVYNVTLTVDPRCDKAYVSARNMNIEVFYK